MRARPGAGPVAGRLAAGFLLAVLAACGRGERGAEPVQVYAAASIAAAIEEAARPFTEETGVAVVVRADASGTLARAMERGAPADLFVAADDAWLDHLTAAGLLDPESRVALAGNALVLVAPLGRDTPVASLRDLPRARRFAMGDPETVPVGAYAETALRRAGLWEAAAPRRVEGRDARQVLLWAERGEVDAALVYATDAARGRVQVVERIPSELCPPVVYAAALTRRGAGRREPRMVLSFLASPRGRAAFAARGFGPAERE